MAKNIRNSKEIQVFVPNDKYNQLKQMGFTEGHSNAEIGLMGIDSLISQHNHSTRKTLNGYPQWFVENSVDKIILYDYLKSLSKNNWSVEEKHKIVRHIFQHFKQSQEFMKDMTDPQSVFYIKLISDELGQAYHYKDLIEEQQEKLSELEHQRNIINSDMFEKQKKMQEVDKVLEEKQKLLQEIAKEKEVLKKEVEELSDNTFDGFEKHYMKISDIMHNPKDVSTSNNVSIYEFVQVNTIFDELERIKNTLDKRKTKHKLF